MHVPCPLFDLKRSVFVLQYRFLKASTQPWMINKHLQNTKFLLKYFVEVLNNNYVCAVQRLIYIRLLTITRWHNKAAVVTKMLVNRCTTLTCWLHRRLTLSDIINFVWCNKFINTYPTSLLTHSRVSHLSASDLKTKAN